MSAVIPALLASAAFSCVALKVAIALADWAFVNSTCCASWAIKLFVCCLLDALNCLEAFSAAWLVRSLCCSIWPFNTTPCCSLDKFCMSICKKAWAFCAESFVLLSSVASIPLWLITLSFIDCALDWAKGTALWIIALNKASLPTVEASNPLSANILFTAATAGLANTGISPDSIPCNKLFNWWLTKASSGNPAIIPRSASV